ncbi:sensor histidine kinase [Desmospora activa]|uniref:histidine kinase n=1 Tax=Desmospora activa DSM 45169 TaxID=1121389 RepID=A0A2T4ZCP7_9BACL|nr:HAMP domain-containing sensor histidine kinase [Desmospora activa]PTM59666.1 signal transduction histidine kinase [Desmospora activa DSM 45169]
MSIRMKLLFSFIAMILIPLVLFCLVVTVLLAVFSQEIVDVNEYYGVGDGRESVQNVKQFFDQRNDLFAGIKFISRYEPDRLVDAAFLKEVDGQFRQVRSGLVIQTDNQILYQSPFLEESNILAQLQRPGAHQKGNHMVKSDGRLFVVEKHSFTFADGRTGTMILVSDSSQLIEFVRKFLPLLILSLLLVIGLTNGVLTFLLSRSIIKPLFTLKHAAEHIKEGNLDHEVRLNRKDEIGQLGATFEEMRSRLKESIQTQLQYEENRKELISNISHDLKTPITAIKGCAEGIRDGIADTDEKRDKYIDMIYKKAVDMDHLIDELFLFSKLDLKRVPFHFEHVDIVAFLQEYVEELHHSPQMNGIQVEFQAANHRIDVIADREKLGRVISNIVDNSVKYMDKAEKQIRFGLVEAEDKVTVTIEDNGQGIAPEALPHIFDRFYRAEESRNTSTGGSGLGLAIVKHIVNEHGGHIWAESELGVGTHIYFALPKPNGISGDE